MAGLRVPTFRPSFLFPLFAATVHETHILVAINLELPKREGGKPVVVVAVENHGIIVGDPRRAAKLLKLILVGDVAPNVVVELRGPIPSRSVLDVTFFVSAGIYVHFHKTNIRVIGMRSNPFRTQQNFGVFVIGHFGSPPVEIRLLTSQL
jgi:hypothetical protein